MKIAIIGAGINGLYLAWKFSKNGEQVTVFEKREKIGKEACSGLFSERILEFIPQSQKLIQNQIDFVLIHFPKKTIRVDFARKFFVMNHAELDKLTADLAEKSGVKINLNCAVERDMTVHSVLPTRLFAPRSVRYSPVPDFARDSGSPHPNPSIHSHITLSSEFDLVIGCDGANSEVRKSLELSEPNYRLGILGFVPEKNNLNFVETWPVKNGFIWKIPRGNELEYGIIAEPNEARKLLDDFCQRNNLLLKNIKSALVPQGLIIPKNSKINLCGDASGLTKPWSGGGVIWGLIAADLLLKNSVDLLKYHQAMKNAFYFKIFSSKLIVKAVYFLGFHLPWLLPKRIKINGDSLL